MAFNNLAVIILQQISPVAVQDARIAAGQRGGMVGRVQPFAASLNADNLNFRVIRKRAKQPHRIGAAANTGNQRIGKRPRAPAFAVWFRAR